MRTIGLSGFAQSGKTTAAKYIEEHYGFERRHIAEPLRAMLASLMSANQIPPGMIDRYLTGDLKDGAVIPEFGVTSRHLQVTLGTEWGREEVNPDLWVDTWHRGIAPGQKAMNDSVRFPNEENAIHEDRGITILIRRAGTRPGAFKWGWLGGWLYDLFGCMWGVHDSERTDRLNPTVVIDNDGELDELYAAIDDAMAAHGVPRLSANDNEAEERARLAVPVIARYHWAAKDLESWSTPELRWLSKECEKSLGWAA